MGTIFNSKVFKGVSIAGKIVKGMVKNGVTFYEKKELPSNAILDLPFQNNFTDYGKIGMTMIAGGTSNQPTFALSGRVAGEYCAVFNGSQSIKTATNLPINSDKVTIKFWIKKTSQTLPGTAILETGTSGTSNLFAVLLGSYGSNLLSRSRNSGVNENSTSIADNTWIRVAVVIDRTQNGINEIKTYFNGNLATSTKPNSTDNTGNFTNDILHIGQRAGSSVGFEGSLMHLEVLNYPITAGEALADYNSFL